MHTRVSQYLGSDAISAQVHAATLRRLRGARSAFKLGQQLFTGFTAIEQYNDTFAMVGNMRQRRIQTPRVHLAANLQSIQDRQRLVHARGDRFFSGPTAFDQSDVYALAGGVSVGLRSELTKRCLYRAATQGFDQ